MVLPAMDEGAVAGGEGEVRPGLWCAAAGKEVRLLLVAAGGERRE